MIFERVRSEGLAQISYFIGSDGEAAVIDPRRDCQVYIDLARREEVRIRYIFETHRNEDYVIGSLELARLTEARIFHGQGLGFKYGEKIVDGQKFYLGTLKLTALHTPGHSKESMSYALTDTTAGDEPFMVFTGDALFVGDVGRTDLSGPAKAAQMAGALYDSIFNKLFPLGDGVIICPAHGAGSVCGGAISEREQSTLGLERVQNPVLRKSREDFVRFKVSEHHERPPYFSRMERYNLEGPPLLENLPNPIPFSPQEFREQLNLGAVVVDTRNPIAFGGGHIQGSYSIWLRGLPSFAGWVLPYDKPILLVMEGSEHLDMAVRYLIRLGYDWLIGYLHGGLNAWYGEALPVEGLGLLTVQELNRRLTRGEDLMVLDVRGEDEWDSGHIEGAIHIYVGHLQERIKEVPTDRPVAAICSIGNRTSLAASTLLREGYVDVYNVLGGMTAWKKANYPTTR